jgi:two-component sensor histidine kinase
MALIHEELYRSQELSRVNFAEYIQKLASALRQTYLLNSNTALVVDVEEVFLGVDTAIPCGLVISELVTNAFKYAYPDGKGGEILIKLRGCAPGLYQLSVSDQGIGLPSDFDIQQSETLGLQLVTILIRQLRATLQVKRTGGTDFQIEFSELKRGDRVGNSH